MLPSVPPSAQGRRLRESLTSSHSILSQSSHASSMVRLCTCAWRGGACVRRQWACARNTIVPPTLTSCSSPLHQSTYHSSRVAASNARTNFTHSRMPHAHTRIHAKTCQGGKRAEVHRQLLAKQDEIRQGLAENAEEMKQR
jgi:hypothetical protein